MSPKQDTSFRKSAETATPRFIGINEAAKLYGLPASWLREQVRAGTIPALRAGPGPGGKIMLNRVAADRALGLV